MKTTRLLIATLTLLLTAQVMAGSAEDERELRLAADVGDVETVTKLLDKGVSPDSANKFGKNALMIAVENNNFETVVLLLNRGANVTART
ncbi:MAG: ankyrin repeat domain-containing protein, partial [Candidatus Thiodiazotropha taylori]|nr:ankyrin repeat domain-containing protein [Candidatus Thiodiazotropha taylori]MCW4254074.1 ankyrin repeat domain-containing protein [Candidatus Thiodiazotropha taylori]